MTRYLANISIGLLVGYYFYFNIGIKSSFAKLLLITALFCGGFILLKKCFKKEDLLSKVLLHTVVFCMSFCFAISYATRTQVPSEGVRSFKGQVVVKDIDISFSGTKVIVYSKDTDKNIIFTSHKKESLLPGDVLDIYGELTDNVVIAPERNKDSWESFDYSKYLRSRNISASLKVKSYEKVSSHITLERISFKFRSFVLEKLNKVLPDQDAGVVLAMSLGDNRALDKNLKDSFQNAGLTHVLVFSGFNFAALIAVFSLFIKSFSKKTQIVLSGLFVILLTFTIPLSAATARAGVFVSYALLASLINKSYSAKFILWVFILKMVILTCKPGRRKNMLPTAH